MSNEIVIPSLGTPVNVENIRKGVNSVDLPQGGNFVKYNGNKGTWELSIKGQKAGVEADTLFVPVFSSGKTGFKEWCDGQPGGSIFVSWGQTPDMKDLKLQYPNRAGTEGHRISPTLTLDFVCVSKPFFGEKLVYSPSSKGGFGLLDRLTDAYQTFCSSNPDVAANIPVVRCVTLNSYESFGATKYNPDLEILYWDSPSLEVTLSEQPQMAIRQKQEVITEGKVIDVEPEQVQVAPFKDEQRTNEQMPPASARRTRPRTRKV